MRAKRRPAQSPRSTRWTAPLEARNHTCIECPACGTETCKVLQDLGMYCDTACAAYEAMRGEPRRNRKLAVL